MKCIHCDHSEPYGWTYPDHYCPGCGHLARTLLPACDCVLCEATRRVAECGAVEVPKPLMDSLACHGWQEEGHVALDVFRMFVKGRNRIFVYGQGHGPLPCVLVHTPGQGEDCHLRGGAASAELWAALAR